ncbi:MAG: DUF5677 domain-containing protein [Gammaproteobacteria bacterium]
MTDAIVQQQVDFLGYAHDTALDAARQLKFDADKIAQVFVVSLHGTIVELAGACLSLLGTGNSIAIPILLRSMHEALADQINLLVDAKYVENMEAADLKQMERLLVQADGDANNLLKGLGEKWNIPKELEQLRGRQVTLKAAGRGALNVFERFKKAGLQAEYQSAYLLLCLDSHGNASALMDRHIEFAGDNIQLSFFKDPPVTSTRARVDAVTAILINSTVMIHEAFKTACTTVQPLRAEHAKLRQDLLAKKAPPPQ